VKGERFETLGERKCEKCVKMKRKGVVGQCLYRSWKRGKGNVGRVKWGFCGKG